MSNKISFGGKNYKYFIGYLHNDNKVKPSHIMFPKTSPYGKSFDQQTKWMFFLNADDDLLEKYNTIWGKSNGDTKKKKKEFDSKHGCNKELLKTKKNLMTMRLQIFTIKKSQRWTLIIFV